MKIYMILILLVFLGFQLSVTAAGDEITVKCELCHKDPQNILPHVNGRNFCINCHNNQSHNIHIGPDTVGLECKTCHGSPPNVTEAHTYSVCGNCHAAPPNSLEPSFGNLIIIHISRGKYCTNCHGMNFDTIHSGAPTPEPMEETERIDNIENQEKYDLQLTSGIVTSHKFSDKTNPILSVEITSNVNTGIMTAAIYILKGTSSLVKWPAPGIVYKNFDISVGTAGFATPNNIRNALVRFKVDNLWVDGNKVKLVKWDGGQWIELKTTEVSKDDLYIYYEAKINSFSPFAIIKNDPTVTATPFIHDTPPAYPPNITTIPQDGQNSKVAILEVVYNIERIGNEAKVTLTLKNIGSSTARLVNLSMNLPTGLGTILDSGAKMDGNTMVWKGEIESGKEHVITYRVGQPNADIEIPVKVTYINSDKTLNKVMASASANGMNASAMPISPQDLQTIQLIIQIAKSLLSGFEIVFAIAGIGVVYSIGKFRSIPPR